MNSLMPLDLNGVPFKKTLVRGSSTRGTPYSRWIPFGMPQLGEYKWIMDTVVFLYPTEDDALKGTEFGGTGFLVAVPSKRWPEEYFHVHAVTNWHVLTHGKGAPVIRVNRRDGGIDAFDFDPSEWTFAPLGSDIAISPPLALDPNTHQAEAFGLDALLTSEQEKADDIDAAEDIFMLGRFVDMDGSETNKPAFRFGNISVASVNVKQPTGYTGRSIVADMHSRTGFSGSPVFVYRTPGSVFLPTIDLSVTWKYMKMIGLLWGQYPEAWEIENGKSLSVSAYKASVIENGKYVVGLSGMCCLVPSQDIINLLQYFELNDIREQNEVALEKTSSRAGLLPKPMVNNQPLSSGTVRAELEAGIAMRQAQQNEETLRKANARAIAMSIALGG